MRVLVTRPETEAQQWSELLRQRGFDALPLPLIAVGPVAEPAPLHAAWRRLKDFRAVMFVSGNAARGFFARRPAGAPWPAPVRAWATGPGTREALLEAGVSAALIDAPPPDAAQFDSETLWHQVAGQVAQGDRVLIARGGDADGAASGRDWLADQLLAAGAQVEVVVVYLRRAPDFTEVQLQRMKADAAGSVWLFSSSQAIAHLQAALPQQDWSSSRAVATHPRIGQTARRAGFGVVCESRPALDAVVAALESFR
jgi:uroporphyrinogen-III synthase